MSKDPLDLVAYQQLIWELRPRTVVEIGAYVGGTTSWLADLLLTYEMDARVIALDIDLSLLDERVRDHSGIDFIEGDAARIADALPPAMLQSCPHPWLVIEDAHVNLYGVLTYFHRFLEPGDYVIVEDTNPDSPAISRMGLDESLGYERAGMGKLEIVKQFMSLHGEGYRVDTYYADLFGYNGTWNWNAFLRRV